VGNFVDQLWGISKIIRNTIIPAHTPPTATPTTVQIVPLPANPNGNPNISQPSLGPP
jgi:hypothetical protein